MWEWIWARDVDSSAFKRLMASWLSDLETTARQQDGSGTVREGTKRRRPHPTSGELGQAGARIRAASRKSSLRADEAQDEKNDSDTKE